MRLVIDIDLDSPALVIPDEGRLDMTPIEQGIGRLLREAAKLSRGGLETFVAPVESSVGARLGRATVLNSEPWEFIMTRLVVGQGRQQEESDDDDDDA